jgi:hypothetical protein
MVVGQFEFMCFGQSRANMMMPGLLFTIWRSRNQILFNKGKFMFVACRPYIEGAANANIN